MDIYDNKKRQNLDKYQNKDSEYVSFFFSLKKVKLSNKSGKKTKSLNYLI